MIDGKLKRINIFIQNELRKRNLSEVSAVKAAKWLDQAGILKDSADRPGLPLRRLLCAGLISGQRQDANRRRYIDLLVKSGSESQLGKRSAYIGSSQPAKSEVLSDIICRDLGVVFIGTVVSDISAERGHYYSNPRNSFYRELFNAGLTPELLSPEEDKRLLEFGIGLTDVLKYAHASDDRLVDSQSLRDGADTLQTKLRKYRPKWVCFNGKNAYKAFAGSSGSFGECGLFDEIRIFIVPSTSGQVSKTRVFDGLTRSEWFSELARLLKRPVGRPRDRV